MQAKRLIRYYISSLAKRRPLPGFGAPARIAAFPEAGPFGDRIGVCYGFSVPSQSGVGPVIGAEAPEARQEDEDLALSVYFEDTGEQEWFAPHLVERVDNAADTS